MNEIKFQSEYVINCPEVEKVKYSKKNNIIIVITNYYLFIYKYPTLKLIQISKIFANNFLIHELENGNFLLLYGDIYSKIIVAKFNKEQNKLELIQRIVEKKENWDKSYYDNVQELDIDESYYCSYISEKTKVVDFFNSNLIVLLTRAKEASLKDCLRVEEKNRNILIFYKYDEKEKQYKSFIANQFCPLEISKFENSDILISVDNKDYDKIIIDLRKNIVNMKKMDLNDETNYFGYNINIKSNYEFQEFHNIYFISDKNNDERIFLGKNKKNRKYYFYSYNIKNNEIQKLNRLKNYDSTFIRKVLSFKNDNIISITTYDNLDFYFFDSKKGIKEKIKNITLNRDRKLEKKDEDIFFIQENNSIKAFRIIS